MAQTRKQTRIPLRIPSFPTDVIIVDFAPEIAAHYIPPILPPMHQPTNQFTTHPSGNIAVDYGAVEAP